MDKVDRWYFTQDRLINSPSRKFCVSESKELLYRQQSAHFIQDLGQQLKVNLLCINNAIIYMHRFYMFHSFSEVHWSALAMAAIFLAAKAEEQARKMEHVIKCACYLLQIKESLDVASEFYKIKEQELVACETILISTLAGKDLGSMSYLLATTSLQLTTLCLMYKPQTVACVCFYLACKWSQWKIDPCSKGKDWFHYADQSMTYEKLEDLANKYLEFLEAAPARFKKKLLEKKAAIDGPVTSKIKANNTTESTKQDNPLPERKEHEVHQMIPVKSLQSELLPTSSSAQLSVKPSASNTLASSVSLSSHSEMRREAAKEHLTFLKAFHLRREQRKNQNSIPKNTSGAHQVKMQETAPHKFIENLVQKSKSQDDSCSVAVTELPTNVQADKQDKLAFSLTELNQPCTEYKLSTNNLEFKYPAGPTKQGISLPGKEKTDANVIVSTSSSTQLSVPQLECLHTGKPTEPFTSNCQKNSKFLSKEFKDMKSFQHASSQRKELSVATVNIPVCSLAETSLLQLPSQLSAKPLTVNSHDKFGSSKIKTSFVSQNMVLPKKEKLVVTEKAVVNVPRSSMPSSRPSTSKQTALHMPLISDSEGSVKAEESFQGGKYSSNRHQDPKGLQILTSVKSDHILKCNPDNLFTPLKVHQQINDPVNVPVVPVKPVCVSKPVVSDKLRTNLFQRLKNDPKIIKNVLPTIVYNSMPRNQQPCKGSNLAILEAVKQKKITHMVQPVKTKLETPNVYRMGNISGVKVKIPKELVTLKYIVTKPNKIPEISSTANIPPKENKMKSSEVLKIIATDKSGTYIMAAKGDSDKGSLKRPHDFDLSSKHSTKHQKLDHSKVKSFQHNVTKSNMSVM
ncbi:uncharacterized protein [Parasteatoda tepidariorum]|uniref:uncharacterized protein isoform X2 n=1 Tax=Parasteatoda tepidariorum TaxID=114398 RepID=UPI001C725E23|nr:uncharacterized protein LOC107445702 isoform X2 [Parasteatoda tepidariorum]